MAAGLLTPEQIRRLRATVVQCGTCRQLAELAQSLGRDDADFRDQIAHQEGAAQSALDIDAMIQRGEQR